jgi:hypothetical protein
MSIIKDQGIHTIFTSIDDDDLSVGGGLAKPVKCYSPEKMLELWELPQDPVQQSFSLPNQTMMLLGNFLFIN